MSTDEIYMHRCFQLARLGTGLTMTNPLVGAVLVYQNRIIGEGFHSQYGAPHGEREAINSVLSSDQKFLKDSTLYVSLEPCCHHGKTPPCTDAILQHQIKKVVVSILDPYHLMNGAGIQILKSNGIEVQIGLLETEGKMLNKFFLHNVSKERPYIILKYASSSDGFIGSSLGAIRISNDWSQYIVHKIRNQVDAILIGTNTALIDNPFLTNRLYYGKNPIRVILDREGKIPASHHLFNSAAETWLITQTSPSPKPRVQILPWEIDLTKLLSTLYSKGIGSMLVEGGASVLNSFISTRAWDEAWITQSPDALGHGIKGPIMEGKLENIEFIGTDKLSIYRPI